MSVVAQLVERGRRVARRGRPLLHAVHPAPAGARSRELEGVLDRGVVREPDPAHGHAAPSHAAATASSIRSSISAQPGPAWRWTRNSRLPSGPWIGDAMTARVPSPSAAAALDGLAQDAAMDRAGRGRRRPWRRPLPASNWGFTSATIGPPPSRRIERDRAEDEAERDERDVDDGEVDGLRAGCRR